MLNIIGISEMQIETTMKCHYTPKNQLKFVTLWNTLKDAEKIDHLDFADGVYKMIHSLWIKEVCKINKIYI